MAAARAKCLAAGESFGIETTFTRRWRLGLLREATTGGYAVDVIFVGTQDPTINVRRVCRRAKRNEGHLVPRQTVRRRWTRVQENLVAQRAAFRSIRIIDSTNDPPVEAARIDGDKTAILIKQPATWISTLIKKLQQAGERRRIEEKDEDGGIENRIRLPGDSPINTGRKWA